MVTGGASGIGAEIVRGFAEQDARVGFLDMDGGASATLAAEIGGNLGVVTRRFLVRQQDAYPLELQKLRKPPLIRAASRS